MRPECPDGHKPEQTGEKKMKQSVSMKVMIDDGGGYFICCDDDDDDDDENGKTIRY